MLDHAGRSGDAQLFVALVAALAPMVGRPQAESRDFAIEMLRRDAGSGPRLISDVALLLVAMASGRPTAAALSEAKERFSLRFVGARRYCSSAGDEASAPIAAALKDMTWGAVVEELLRAFAAERLTAAWMGDKEMSPFGVQFGVTNQTAYATFELKAPSANDDGTHARDVFTFMLPFGPETSPLLLVDRRGFLSGEVFQRAGAMLRRCGIADDLGDRLSEPVAPLPIDISRHKEIAP